MKHYKLVECLPIFSVSSPPHKPKALPQKRKAPYGKLFGDGSVSLDFGWFESQTENPSMFLGSRLQG